MPKSTKQIKKIKRSFPPMNPDMQRDYDRLHGSQVQAVIDTNVPPSREASQTSSHVGVQKNAPDASSPGVSLDKASKHSHRRSRHSAKG